MFATCLGLFSLTILNEGLKSYRLHRARCGGQSADDPVETAAEEAAGARGSTERTLLLLTSTGRGHNSGSMSSVRRRRIMQESKDFER